MRKALLFTLLLGACAEMQPALMPSDWQVVSVAGSTLADDAGVTIDFAEGRISGRSGCNRYTGPVTLGEGTIDVGLLAVTRMACPGAAGVTEGSFLRALDRADGYRIVRGDLELSDSDRVVLRARRR